MLSSTKRLVTHELDMVEEQFLRAAAPLAARCFAERAEDLLLADDAALAELGPARASRLRTELRSAVASFERKPGAWAGRRWPHRDRKSQQRTLACWDRSYVEHQAAVWLSDRSPVKLPLATRARIRP